MPKTWRKQGVVYSLISYDSKEHKFVFVTVRLDETKAV